jgi:carbamoyltransferase
MPFLMSGRHFVIHLLSENLGCHVPEEKLFFCPHHRAHALSTLTSSGFERALIFSVDGQGDRDDSGLVATGTGSTIDVRRTIPVDDSLGFFYEKLIHFVGFTYFDEYKVMGLAPYGDPKRFREKIQALYSLNEDGSWNIHSDRFDELFSVLRPRRRWEALEAEHRDFAAALQEALEEMALHALRYWRKVTGEANLCLAGGVALNCTMNARIVESGLFDRVFVHPASHDAGCAWGAALHAYDALGNPPAPREPLRHVFLGRSLPEEDAVGHELATWGDFLTVERVDDSSQAGAAALADGLIVGWAQGRSEFGPRALGHRSIVADPRPAENKDRINAAVKKREAFRPFAPAVSAEAASEFFDLPPGGSYEFMTIIARVQPAKRELLGAVTHVDGTARVQVVSNATDEKFWKLINAFGQLTGVPVVLNTSFNNNEEPIVDSVHDAVTCFLTTGLDKLIIGNHVVSKKDYGHEQLGRCRVELPLHVELRRSRRYAGPGDSRWTYSLLRPYKPQPRVEEISEELYGVLKHCDGEAPMDEATSMAQAAREATIDSLVELWHQRWITLYPGVR